MTTLATWDGDQLVVDLVGGVPTLYVRGVGLIASVGTATEYFLYNAHGDVVQVVNASGAVQKTYVYDAYGNQMSLTASDANPFRYASQYYDRESGNIYLRARYYMPRTGRFLTEDVAGDGINWYTYCGGNPVMFVDISGYIPTPVEAAEMAQHIYNPIYDTDLSSDWNYIYSRKTKKDWSWAYIQESKVTAL